MSPVLDTPVLRMRRIPHEPEQHRLGRGQHRARLLHALSWVERTSMGITCCEHGYYLLRN